MFEFEGVWLGGAAVVLAESQEQAIELLKEHHGSEPDGYILAEIKTPTEPGVVYYNDGDY